MFKKAEQAKSAILTMGAGRGFVVESLSNRVVISAAHCLPRPPRFGRADQYKVNVCQCARTTRSKTDGLGGVPLRRSDCRHCRTRRAGKAGSWSKESKAYDELVEPIPPLKSIASLRSVEQVKSALRRNYVTPLRIADAPEEGRAWLMSLKGEWFQCMVMYTKIFETPLFIIDPEQPPVRGMSGSPILSDNGKAIGVFCLISDWGSGSPNPRLTRDLPARFLRAKGRKINPDALRDIEVRASIIKNEPQTVDVPSKVSESEP